MNRSADGNAAFAEPREAVDWRLFLGLSRTPHGILDVATPAMAALLCLGHFPSVSVIVVGLVTAFAGYTAVYALNDLVDLRVDKERLALRDEAKGHFDVDGLMVPHPLAQGLLPYRSALLWFSSWAAVALAGAWWLNPICAGLFILSALFETLYCKLLRITYLKILPSAIVKATGGLAGAYAVEPNPSPAFLVMLFVWLAAWELGGQNIANDIIDMDDDARVEARTTATVKGLPEAVFMLIVAASMAAIGGFVVYWFAGKGVGSLYPIGAVILGWKLLLDPARAVYQRPVPETAAALFNKTSHVPLAFLLLTAVSIFLPI